MYQLLKAFNMIRSKAFHSFVSRNAVKIRQILFNNKKRHFYLSFKKRDFEKTIEIGNKLIKKEKNDPELLRAYGLSLAGSGKIEEGERMLRNALNAIENCNYEKVLAYSQKTFNSSTSNETKHLALGGYTNYGFLKHDLSSSNAVRYNLITKITQFESLATNYERRFYLEIGKKHPELLTLAPKLADYHLIPRTKVELLTIDFIDSKPPDHQDFNEILRINKVIEAISYEESLSMFEDVETKIVKYIPFLLHRKMINKEALYEIRHLAAKTSDGQALNDLVDCMDAIIMGKKLYKKIRPDIHYAFCHNDFHWKNILVQEKTDKHFVIDWNNFGIAMRGWDMNYYFGNFRYSFHEIEKLYLSQIQFDDPTDEKIAKIYFAFLQVYMWMKRLSRHPYEDYLTTHFAPAVRFMEEISADL